MNNKVIIYTLMAIAALLAGCSADDETTAYEATPTKEARFTVSGKSFATVSRAYPTSATADQFSLQDTIGLWVVKDGAVTMANVPLICDGLFWGANGVTADAGATYFAMSPYASNDYINTLLAIDDISNAVDPSAKTATEFFKKINDAWTPLNVQQTLRQYYFSDLMVAMGKVNAGDNTINLQMAHRMGLALITVADTVKASQKDNTDNMPLYWAQQYRFIVKPQTTTTLHFTYKRNKTNNNATLKIDTLALDVKVNNPGAYRTYTINSDLTTE